MEVNFQKSALLAAVVGLEYEFRVGSTPGRGCWQNCWECKGGCSQPTTQGPKKATGPLIHQWQESGQASRCPVWHGDE